MTSPLLGEAAMWLAVPPAQSTEHSTSCRFTLLPAAANTRYAIRAEWAEMANSTAQRTRHERTAALGVAAHETGLCLALRTEPAPSRKSGNSAFGDAARLLAGLYDELDLDAAPNGAVRGLLNHAGIARRWHAIRAELRRRYGSGSDAINGLVGGVDAQLAQPGGLAPSLAYTYWYEALLLPVYAHTWHPQQPYTRPRAFPAFFDGLDLHLTETARLLPFEPLADALTLRLTGAATPATLAALAAYQPAALGPDAPPPDPAAVRVAYEATHCLDRATGRPRTVELALSCAYAEHYRKEYFLSIEQL